MEDETDRQKSEDCKITTQKIYDVSDNWFLKIRCNSQIAKMYRRMLLP